MSYYQLQLHPVWEEKLPKEEILAYEQLVEAQVIVEDELTNTSVRAKYKKDGGFLATVLINNGLHQQITMNEMSVSVLDANSELIAEGTFAPNLHIEAFCSQPWSFVFSKDWIQCYDADLQQWKVIIKGDFS